MSFLVHRRLMVSIVWYLSLLWFVWLLILNKSRCVLLYSWACSSKIHEIVAHVGHNFDALHAQEVAQTAVFVGSPYTHAKDQWPHIVAKFPDRLIIFAPPGWEVDSGHRPCLDDENTGSKLSRYVQSLGRGAISCDPDHGIGILHRLDVPC